MNALDRLRLLRDTLPTSGSVVLTRDALSELLGESTPETHAPEAAADLTVEEIGEQLNRAPNTVRNWIRAGDLRAYRFGKEYRCTRAALEEFIQAQRDGKREIAGNRGTAGKPADLGRWRQVRNKAA